MKVLVTGGAGFIGSVLCRLLIAETPWTVINLDKLTYASSLASLAEVERSDRYRFVQGDIADGGLVADLLARFEIDAVINLAAETHVDRSIGDAGPFVTTNVVGVYTLLNAALDHWERLGPESKARFRFLQVSTDEVFGSLGPTGRFHERSRYEPRSPYSATKAAADHLVSAWGATYGLPVLITNCSNNYGPYQFPEKLIPLALLNLVHGQPVPVYGDGRQVRDWLFVEDHARAIKRVLEAGRPGETYCVGGEAERTNLQVVQALCDSLERRGKAPGARDLIRFVADRPGHDRRYAIDASKVRAELGWAPTLDFETGLERTIDWYLAREDWWGPLRARYSGERLGLRT